MGTVIILDKSTIQSLSPDEIVILHRYYLLNIAPVLAVEILADLKKPSTNSLSPDKVVQLAGKLLPYDSTINVPYKDLIIGSLLGHHFNMDNRPIIGGGQPVKTADGETGIIFEETLEEQALARWRNGEFTGPEKILAERWRDSTRSIDIEASRKHLRGVFSALPKFKSLLEVKEFLDVFLLKSSYQIPLLALLISEFNPDYIKASEIFYRWDTGRHKNINDFAPYAFYCFSVILFFQFALMNDLVGTRATNRVDLEYIYYLPFCMVFGSNDKFHHLIAPYFLRPDQSLVNGEELKANLNDLLRQSKQFNEGGTLEWKQEFGLVPPKDQNSLTSILWEKHMQYSGEKMFNMAANMTKEQEKKLADFINKKVEKATSDSTLKHFDSDRADFIIKKHKISIDDLCPCGSGRQFKDCHGKHLD